MDVEFDNSCARRESRGPREPIPETLLISVSLPGRRLGASLPHQNKTQGYAVGFAWEEVANACPPPGMRQNVFNPTESGQNAELVSRSPTAEPGSRSRELSGSEP